MCLAVPGEIIEITADGSAVVNFIGAEREVALDLIRDAREGDWVIVHAGFAIQKLDRNEALKTLEYFRQIAEYSSADPGA